MSPDTAVVLTILSIIISLGTIAFAILRGREMIAKAALEAVGSLEGRAVVLAITNEKHDRIEEKLDSIQEKLHALTTAVSGITVRLAVIEERNTRREER
jgi:hypothetical protein